MESLTSQKKPLTLGQVKADIASGKCKTIYWSAHTLWWTHLDEDVTEATESGEKVQEIRLQQIDSDPNVPASKKERLKSLFAKAKESGSHIPLDPTGSPLLMTDEVSEWIKSAESKPTHFGIYGLEAFILAHHQNCSNLCFQSWDGYNNILHSRQNKN